MITISHNYKPPHTNLTTLTRSKFSKFHQSPVKQTLCRNTLYNKDDLAQKIKNIKHYDIKNILKGKDSKIRLDDMDIDMYESQLCKHQPIEQEIYRSQDILEHVKQSDGTP